MDEGEKRSEEEGGRVLNIGLTVDGPLLGSVIFSSFNGGAKYSPFNGKRGCYEIAVNLRGGSKCCGIFSASRRILWEGSGETQKFCRWGRKVERESRVAAGPFPHAVLAVQVKLNRRREKEVEGR